MAKINDVEYMCFTRPDGAIELRDERFESFVFDAEKGIILIKDVLGKTNYDWQAVSIPVFRRMVRNRMDQNLLGLSRLL